MILSCTNRPDSNTLRVSRVYERILGEKHVPSLLFDLSILPRDIAFSETFGKRTAAFENIMKKFIAPHRKLIFVLPEYNGSLPGLVKTFIDSTHPREWEDRHACLVGVADGRAGNLRGLEHLTGILNYMKVHVYHNKLPISAITNIMDENGEFANEVQLRTCRAQIEGFLKI